MCQKRKSSGSEFSISLHAILLTGLFLSVSVSGDAKSELDALTGGIHTRVAYRVGGEYLTGGSQKINGFDSETGQIHTIWSDGVVKSVLTDGGNKLLVTSLDYKVWVVDWDGTNKRQLATGSVSDGWCDPQTGKYWAVFRGNDKNIYRVLIENPGTIIKIYNGGNEGISYYPWFQISADGKLAASFFPWNDGGVFDISTQKVTLLSKGCWSGMTSNNSYYWFHLTADHKNLMTFQNQTKIATVNVMPPIAGKQIYCPRPAEGPEHGGLFFALCGGYPEYNVNANTVEVFVGKMSSSYNSVVGWARITHDNEADQHPTLWVGVVKESSPSTSMTLSPVKLSFTETEGASTVEPKTVTVTPEEGELENVTVEHDKSWLNITVKKSGNIWEIENEPDITGLSSKVYHAQVKVKASNAESKTYEVELTVEAAKKLTTIKVSPPTPAMMAGNTQTFSAEALDQFGQPMSPKPSITWSVNTTRKIDENGKFTAPDNAGEYTVTAQAGDIKGTANVTVVTIEITSEHKDKSYYIGDEITVTWTASEGITGVNLWISCDNGKNWLLINEDASIDLDDYKGTYSWIIPSEFNEIPLENTKAIFKVADYWNEKLNIRSEEFSISSEQTIITGGVSPTLKPLSMKMTGPRTLDLHVNQKGAFEVEFINPLGKTVEKFSGHGPSKVRLIGETAGVYMVRLNGMFGEINKKVFMW